MTVELATAYVSLVPSARGISGAISRELTGPTQAVAATAGGKAGTSFSKKFTGTVGRFAKSTAGVLGLVGAAALVTKQITASIGEAEEAQRVTRDTAAVIKSMGGAANISAAGVAALAEKISLNVGVDDELIQSGQNLLLTFKNIRNEAGEGNDVFNQASQIMVDLSARFKTDIPGAAKILGKALNDPIAGLTSLGRIGVQFTQQQKDQIKVLVESGDIMGAQKIILQELSDQTKGSAAAQATASDKLKVAFANLQETVGTALLPVVEKFSTWMTKTAIPAIEKLIGWMKENKTTMVALAAVVGGILVAAFTAWAVSVIAATWPILAIGAAVGVLAVLVIKHWDTIKAVFETGLDVIQGVFEWVKTNWPLLLAIITGPVGLAVLALTRYWDTIYKTVTGAVDAVLGFVKRNWQTIVAILVGPIAVAILAIRRNWDIIKAVFRAGVNFITSLWSKAWTAVKNFVTTTTAAIAATITRWRDTIIRIFSNAVRWLYNAGRNIVKGLWDGILVVASQMFGYLSRIPGRIKNNFVNAGKWLLNAGKQIITGLWNGLKDKWKDVTDWIGGLGGVIKNLKGPPRKDLELLRPAGRAIMGGFFEELKRGQGPIFNLMRKLGVWISDLFGGGGGGGRGVGGGALSGLEDTFEAIVRKILSLGGGAIRLVSGYRSTAQQARLYYNYTHGIGGQALAAPPGRSKHEKGLAVDFGGNRALYTRLAHRFGLVAPVPGEPWHWQPRWAGQTHSYYERGAWRTRDEWARLHAGEMVLPATIAGAVRGELGGRGGAGQVYVAPGAVVIGIPAGATVAEAIRLGGAAGKGFLETLAQRRVLTDARIA